MSLNPSPATPTSVSPLSPLNTTGAKKSTNKIDPKAEKAREEHARQDVLLSMFLEDRISEEIRLLKKNDNRLKVSWREIMREVKSDKLREELRVMRSSVGRVLDSKNSVIDALMSDLKEADEQERYADISNIEIMNQFLEGHQKFGNDLKISYNTYVGNIKDKYEFRKTKIKKLHDEGMRKLQFIHRALQDEWEEEEGERRTDLHSNCDEIKNKMMEDKTAMRLSLEAVLDQLYSRFEETYKSYTDETEERLKTFLDLKEKDEKSCKEIDKQMKKLTHLTDSISNLRQKISNNQEDSEVRMSALRDEKEKMLNHLQQLKQQIHENRTHQNEKLRNMTGITSDVKRKLKEVTEIGQKVLKLYYICTKYETQEEKVMPFSRTSLNEEDQAEIETLMNEPCENELAESCRKYFQLTKFWQRMGTALLHETSMNMQAKNNKKNVRALKNVINVCEQDMMINEEALKDPANGVFMINRDIKLLKETVDPKYQTEALQKMQVKGGATPSAVEGILHIRNITKQ